MFFCVTVMLWEQGSDTSQSIDARMSINSAVTRIGITIRIPNYEYTN